ncbi:MAG: hypothetical protein ACI8PZ_001692 [Myxococcota bacterium]|jgi:hypothetical protein
MKAIIAVVGVLAMSACAGEGKGKGDFDKAPDFSLLDVNDTSASYNSVISPRDKLGEVSVWYFGHADCPVCSAYFGELDIMQQQLASEGITIDIVGVNAVGKESDNGVITEGRDLPWLQDTPDEGVWDAWFAEWRDVIVLNSDNELSWRDNLTDNDITIEANYDELYQRIVDTQL